MTLHRIAAILACALPTLVPARDFYVGGSIGRVRADSDFSEQVGRASADETIPPVDSGIDASGKTGGRLFAGMRITSWLALELDYFQLGEYRLRYTTFDQRPLPSPVAIRSFAHITTQAELDGFGLAAVSRVQLAPRIDLFGRAGVARTRLRQSTDACTFASSFGRPAELLACGGGGHPDLKQTRATLGLGVDFRLTERVALRASWDRYFGIGKDFDRSLLLANTARGEFDADLFAVGVTFGF
jgi:opacity protein-like surface antigen